MLKKCSKCGEVKSTDEFCKDVNRKDGLHCQCKKCVAKYYQEHKERTMAQHRKYRQENKEKEKERAKKYRQEHKEERRKSSKKWYQENREKILARHRGYKQTHRGKIVICNSRHKRRTIYQQTDITTDFLEALWNYTKFCVICGKRMEDHGKYPDGKQLDHATPLNAGGEHVMTNVRYICAVCNLTRPKEGNDLLLINTVDPSLGK